jgi:hypothetical protein
MTTATGWRKGQITTLAAVRQTGKSTYMDIANPPAIRILGSATVDGETWHTVQCKPSLVSGWVQEQDPNMWHRHVNENFWTKHFNVFDLHEKLYTMLILKWK